MPLSAPSAIQQAATISGPTGTKPDVANFKEACRQFEAVLAKQMLQSMRDTVSKEGGVLPQSNGQEMFTELRDWEMAKTFSTDQGLGLAQQLYEQINPQKQPSRGAGLDVQG